MKINGQNIVKNSEGQITSGVTGVRTTSLIKGNTDGDTDDVKKARISDDRIEVSAGAKEFNRIKSALKGLPELRDDKVNQVSEQLSSEKYNVDSELVASGIVKESILNKV